jgi:hypothetical protein
MKIRTITAGCEVPKDSESTNTKRIEQIASNVQEIKNFFEEHGYTVQTVRLSTQPWESYASTKTELNHLCSQLQSLCLDQIDYFNIGPISTTNHIFWLYSILKKYPQGFCTVNLCQQNTVQKQVAWETARLIKKISRLEKQGFANLRFAALYNITPNTPFYPASFHQGVPSFGIGCENSDIIYSICSNVDTYEEAFTALTERFGTEYKKLTSLATEVSKKTGLTFYGIDGSISPSVHPKESVVYGIEQLPFVDTFGDPGSLTAARLLTSVIQHLPITRCGYNGLMLPVMEDSGLAQRNKEGYLSLTKLLLFSSVCGTGLDTIPLPGDISVETIYRILLDVGFLSTTLHKPLSARLMPIPNKQAGDTTEFDFDYFENTTVMHP